MSQVNNKFLWGAATSAHQVEGNNTNNDWWDWEQQPKVAQSGLACDHYHLFRDDFRLARELGHNAHRLSIEWSRIEPKPGTYDQQAINHYEQVLLELRQLKLSSFVTLHHFTNPLWLVKQGGWENRQSALRFSQYVSVITEKLGHLIDYWLIINEPMVFATHGWYFGWWPPHKRSAYKLHRVIKNLIDAHNLAYQEIKKRRPGASVGVSASLINYYPDRSWHPGDRITAVLAKRFWNNYFLDRINNNFDFIGAQYYFSRWRRLNFLPPRVINSITHHQPVSDLGWPIVPQGLTDLLIDFKAYRRPIYITENGLADAQDKLRANFIRDHVAAVQRARQAGADVRGYIYWSLLDNFEWSEGFMPRFGLIEVDYKTLARKVRPSAYVYRALINQQLHVSKDR